MTQDIKDIKTPVHVIIELEFSFFRAVVLNDNREVICAYSKPINNSDYTVITTELKHLNILSCKCIVWPEYFALIPFDLDDDTSSITILNSFHMTDCSGLITKKEKNIACQGVLHYGIPPTQQLAILSLYTGAVIKSGLSVSITNLLDHDIRDSHLSCHVSDHSIWLILKLHKRLEFINHFKIDSIEDVLYYISVIVKDKQLDNTIGISLSGSPNSNLINLLKSYYTSVEITENDNKGIPSDFSNLLTPAINENY